VHKLRDMLHNYETKACTPGRTRTCNLRISLPATTFVATAQNATLCLGSGL